ncbi:diguanylate cyclase/phosphodiesterase (GGDEF & EAL domains) with PAS/PAC sensor(s) [hydrothermal vent metagenome]|uniref:Diguanylate cyclase/phosphodiesterase (GGDEF & EAL domains) with PAS/PAC sensor(S) n=1 Tax=hydrothermal vent metagenome TaxID=652676 RepID=A0A3B0YLR3_9ZZZZ
MSLKYRIAIVIFILETVMMTVVFSFTLTRTQQVNGKLFADTENVIVNILADLSRVALITLEYGELRPYIKMIQRDPQVIKVLVLNANNQIVAADKASDIGRMAPSIKTADNVFWHKKTISGVSGELGTVLVKFSHENLRQLNRGVITEGIKIALLGMIIIALIGLLTGFLLTRRLQIVSDAARRISKGQFEVKTQLQGNDELSVLGQLFDQMAGSFKHYIESLKHGKIELRKARDELEVKVAERTTELEYVALHDSLTNLPNRQLYTERLLAAIEFSSVENDHLAVMMIDLNSFKLINDAHGHSTGDFVLIEAAKRFKQALRRSDTVARLGGDEFAIVLPAADLCTALKVADSIQSAIAPAMHIHNHDLCLSCSIGIAIYPEHGSQANLLLQRADIAMYSCKNNNLAHTTYSTALDTDSAGLLSLTRDLKQAITKNQFELYYQPKFSFITGDLMGAEALLRWNRGDEFVMPDTFIPIAEQTNFINELTYWVIEEGFNQCLLWNQHRQDSEIISISINLATKTLDDEELPHRISELLKGTEYFEKQLILEITETGIMADPHHSLNVLRQLDKMGLGISIDDFGTGYSSLVYLKKLPVDEIKIDRAFVMDMLKDNESGIIIRSIIDLAHNLGLTVVAEGVETAEVWNALRELNCNYCQGYFTGKPMSARDFEAQFIHNSHKQLAIKN